MRTEAAGHPDDCSYVLRLLYGVKRIRTVHHPLDNHRQRRRIRNRHAFNLGKFGDQWFESGLHTGFRFSRSNKLRSFFGEFRFGLRQYLPNLPVRRFFPLPPQARHLVCRTCETLLPLRDHQVQFRRESPNVALQFADSRQGLGASRLNMLPALPFAIQAVAVD